MKPFRWVSVGLAALVALAGIGYGARRLLRPRGPETVLPTFVEPGPGPRAPTTQGFGFSVGRSKLANVRGELARRGLACPDTSIRAMMKEMRETRLREMEAKKQTGEAPDAVSGASAMNRPSPKERNPQVRLSCEPVSAALLADQPRPSIDGRWLMVFDSPDLPLRHVSFERTHAQLDEARRDLSASVAALVVRFGQPNVAPRAEDEDLPWLKPVAYEWKFADLHVKVLALNYGKRGVSLSETIEIPWPVRPDAPTRLAVAP